MSCKHCNGDPNSITFEASVICTGFTCEMKEPCLCDCHNE